MPLVTNLGRMVTHIDGLLPIKLLDRFIMGLARSHDKLKSLYLHNHSVYSHQTWKHGDLTYGAPCHKVTWSFDHVVLQNHVLN